MQKPKGEAKRFAKLLAQKGLRNTFERRAILEEVRHISTHFNADGLYERFKKRGERIARATVYRTIPLLLEAGVVQKSAGKGKRDFFEKTSTKGHHDHMICLDCKKIIEFHSQRIEEIQDEMCNKFRFQPVFHDHRIFGHCEKCH